MRADAVSTGPMNPLHPVHAILAASTIPLFLGALLADLAYGATYHPQWKNFAAWLVIGGLVFAGLALAWSVVHVLARSRGKRRAWLYPLLLLATLVAGTLCALVHAKDAWAAMPSAPILSAMTLLLAMAANWAAYRRPARREAP